MSHKILGQSNFQDVQDGGIEDGVPRIRFKEGRSPGKAQYCGFVTAWFLMAKTMAKQTNRSILLK